MQVQRLPTTLTRPGERALLSGHPWLFEGSVEKVKGDGHAGDLAIIFDRRHNRFLGIGLYDPKAPIRIRVLHQGKPLTIDTAFFEQRINKAYSLRQALLQTNTTGYRLIHGENDQLPGLVVDVYSKVAVIKIYTPAWLPWLSMILPIIQTAAKVDTIVFRHARNSKTAVVAAGLQDGQVLVGTLDDPDVIFLEHNLKFVANVIEGHKTGFFLDHRANRLRVQQYAQDKDVLDVFSYAGGFSVHALAGGARSVMSLDISKPALEMARRNVKLNIEDISRHSTYAADAFEGLGSLHMQKQTFDMVIVDPPSFAKKSSEVSAALSAYQRLNTLAIPLIRSGGILLSASCSARVTSDEFFKTVESTLQKSGRKFTLLEKHFHDDDHPIGFAEGAYLKAVYYQLK